MTGVSSLTPDSLFAVTLWKIVSISMLQLFTMPLVAQSGSDDADIFRLLSSQHEGQLLKRILCGDMASCTQSSFMSAEAIDLHTVVGVVLFVHKTTSATNVKVLWKATMASPD
jgi:hypothetical protein